MKGSEETAAQSSPTSPAEPEQPQSRGAAARPLSRGERELRLHLRDCVDAERAGGGDSIPEVPPILDGPHWVVSAYYFGSEAAQDLLTEKPRHDDCTHEHSVYRGRKLLCRYREGRRVSMFTYCPLETPRSADPEHELARLGLEASGNACRRCRLTEEERSPLIAYCRCENSDKLHPECLSKFKREESKFYHRCLKCGSMFLGTRSYDAEHPADLLIEIYLDGRKIFLKHQFDRDDTFGHVLSLLRRLHFIAYIPELVLNSNRVNCRPQWWYAPLYISGDLNFLIVRVPDKLPGFSVAVFYKFKTYFAKHPRLYSTYKDKRTWIQDWEEIRRRTMLSLVTNYKELRGEKLPLTLYQQTATFVWKNEDRDIRKHCVKVMTAPGQECFEDLDTGEVVKDGEMEEVVLEFVSAGCGYFLPKSTKPGLFASVGPQLLQVTPDGEFKRLKRKDLDIPHFVLMLFGFVKIVGKSGFLFYSLADNVIEEIHPHMTEISYCATGWPARPTPDMVRAYIFFCDGAPVSKLVTPCKRKLLFYSRYGYDIRVEGGVVRKVSCHPNDRWGSRWVRLKTSSYLHICISRSLKGCLCHAVKVVTTNYPKGID